MSDAESVLQTVAPSAEIRECAAAWLERRIGEDWTGEDQAAFDAWLDASTAHRIAYLRLETVWTRTYQFAPMRRRAPAPTRRRRFWSALNGVAAGLVVVALTGAGLWGLLGGPKEKAFATGLGERETVTLADGSRIELNTNSALRVAAADPRKVWLDRGEAFFQVRHDTKHPFVVTAGGHRITDLGTKFAIQREAGRVRVVVMEGRVQVALASGKAEATLLTAGDVGLATTSTVAVTRRPLLDLENEVAWQKGLLIFHHTTIADAASQYNRYNRTKIVIADAAAAKLAINGTLPTNDVEAFARLTQKFFDLHVERRSNEIVISR